MYIIYITYLFLLYQSLRLLLKDVLKAFKIHFFFRKVLFVLKLFKGNL